MNKFQLYLLFCFRAVQSSSVNLQQLKGDKLSTKLKVSGLILAIALPITLSGCSSESNKVSEACVLVDKGAAGLKAETPMYTNYYQEAADILKDLAVKNPKYSDPYKAALLWASGNNVDVADLTIMITLNELCSLNDKKSE